MNVESYFEKLSHRLERFNHFTHETKKNKETKQMAADRHPEKNVNKVGHRNENNNFQHIIIAIRRGQKEALCGSSRSSSHTNFC